MRLLIVGAEVGMGKKEGEEGEEWEEGGEGGDGERSIDSIVVE